MLFDKNDERANERVLYKTKPNMFLGCRKAIYGVVLLAIIFVVSPIVIKFVGEMQVYLISRINLPLTRYAAIAFFVVILMVILFIVWQLLKWYSMEYTLTDTRIIIKSGLLSTKKNYMPYSVIQDINSSQSFLARMFNVGTVSTYSAYDNNQISLENISDPSKVEDIIFSNMMGYRNFQQPPRNYVNSRQDPRGYPNNNMMNDNNFAGRNEYYDEYEPITPITHERKEYQPREYEYYPEEFSFQQQDSPNKYEYEPYDDGFDSEINRVVENDVGNKGYEEPVNNFSNERPYDEMSGDYSHVEDNNYHNYEPKSYYDENRENVYQNESKDVEDKANSSETVIRRHFDKFKK